MRVLLLVGILVFCSACSKQACPEIKADKLKRSTYNRISLKRRAPAPSTISAGRTRTYPLQKELLSSNKSKGDVEDWDCPKPGQQKNAKIVRENKKKLEKIAKEKKLTSKSHAIIPK